MQTRKDAMAIKQNEEIVQNQYFLSMVPYQSHLRENAIFKEIFHKVLYFVTD